MLLDVGLPDMDGRDLCRQMRRAAINVPIVMLTAADTDSDTVLGLEAGADDYVTKPFRLNVLLARLRAHLRQSEHRDDAVFPIGPYTFQPGAKLFVERDRRVEPLTITTVRFQQGRPVIGLRGVEDMNAAIALAGTELRVPREWLAALPTGTSGCGTRPPSRRSARR